MNRSAIPVITVAAGCALCCTPSAQADMFNFVFPIDVAQEVPAPTVGGFTPSGTGDVSYDSDTNLLSWMITYSGLTGDIVSPGAHFHGPAMPGATAGIQVDIAGDVGGTGAGATLPQPSSGVLTGSFTISDSQEADLLAGLWYVNIHTQQNPAGEIRGQVVPNPGSVALLSIGAVVAFGRRRRA